MKTGQCLGLNWKSVCTELKYSMFVAQVLRKQKAGMVTEESNLSLGASAQKHSLETGF